MRRYAGEDRGAVTIEAALALCSVTLVLAMALGAVAAAAAQIRCVDAAREIARLVARGEPDRARDIGALIAPGGADVAVSVTGDEVLVEVSTHFAALPGLTVAGRALGVLEPEAFLGDLPTAAATDPSGSR